MRRCEREGVRWERHGWRTWHLVDRCWRAIRSRRAGRHGKTVARRVMPRWALAAPAHDALLARRGWYVRAALLGDPHARAGQRDETLRHHAEVRAHLAEPSPLP
jgi:hypothetical protein